MKGATVSGDLDLEAAIVPHPLDFDDCRIAGQLILRDARTRSIGLEGTSVQGISADRAVIEGALFLRNKFRATGEVRLIGAVIGGVLDCSEGVFEVEEGKERNALNADGLTVKGNVFLKSGFKATGEVRLLNVEIGGNLECSGGVFEVEKGDALSADRATIKGDVFLNDGFKATGEVKLLGAKIGGDLACGGGFFEVKEGAALTVQRLGEVRLLNVEIGGNLECSGGVFEVEKGDALSADRATIKGDVFLNDFKATGEVKLLGAKIGGDLACGGGFFPRRAPHSPLRLTMNGVFFWSPGEISGSVDLMHARVGTLSDDRNAWPLGANSKASWYLDGFIYDALAADSPKDTRFRSGWLAANNTVDGGFAPQPYEQLIKVYKEMGHPAEARAIAIAKQKKLRKPMKLNPLSWVSWNWNWLSWLFLGYGYQTWRVLPWIAGFLVVGYFLFDLAHDGGYMQPSNARIYMACDYVGKKGSCLHAGYPQFSPLIYAVDSFFPIVDLHQETYWLPRKSGWAEPIIWAPDWAPDWVPDLSKWSKVYLWFHIAFGWILTTLAVVGLTGIVKKD